MYVERLETNAKGVVEVDLAPLTLIVGPNASHKSGLVAGLELAILGRSSEVGAQGAEVLTLAPHGSGGRVYARAKMDGGEEASYDVHGSTARASKPEHKGPGAIILTSEVADLLRSDPKRQREAILRVVAPADVLPRARALVPEAFLPLWDDVVAQEKRIGIGLGEADVLVAAVASLRKMKSEAAKASKASATEAPPEAPSPAAIQAMKTQIAQARALADARRKAEGARARLATVEAQIARAQGAIASEGLPSPQAIDTATKRLGVAEAARGLNDERAPRCVCCGASRQSWELEEAAARLERARARLAELRAAIASAYQGPPVAELEEERRALEKAATVEVESTDAEGDGALLPQLEDELRRAEAAVAAREAWDRDRLTAQRALGRADAIAALVKAGERAIAECLEGAVADFERRASAMLGGGEVKIQLFDGARSVCRVGLATSRGEVRSWKALSGAERTALVAAFACAWSAGHTEPYRGILVDDVWLDGEHLRGLCEGLARVVGTEGGPTQAIVCAVEAPKIEGWHRLEVAKCA